MSLVNIKAEIKAILDALVSTNKLQVVYDYPIGQSDQYPYSVIETEGIQDDFLDSASNRVTYTFAISFFDALTEAISRSATENRLHVLCDNILHELRKKSNLTLNGDSVSLRITGVTWGYQGEATAPIRSFTIALEAEAIKSIL